MKMKHSLVLLLWAALASGTSAQGQPTIIRAASAFDGTGRTIPNATIVVRDGRIVSVESGVAPAAPKRDSREGGATYDLRGLTVLPGLIDTHVHLDTHFGKDGRATSRGETPQQSILYEAENAYVTLMAGFTTVQSIGSPLDVDVRAAIARGVMPGPRLLTSIRPGQRKHRHARRDSRVRQKGQGRRRRSGQAVRVEEQPRGRRPDDDRRADSGRVRRGEGGRAPLVGARAQPLVGPRGDARRLHDRDARQPGDRRGTEADAGARHVLRAEHRPRVAELPREQEPLLRHRQLQRRGIRLHREGAFR